MDKQDYDLEVLKLNFSFLKFLLGTFLIGVVTLIINSQLKSKEIQLEKLKHENNMQLQLIKEENEHLSKFVIYAVHEKPEKRRDVAEYFKQVSYTEGARERWNKYYIIAQKKVDDSENIQNELNERLKKISDLAAMEYLNPGTEIEKLISKKQEYMKLKNELDSLRSTSYSVYAPDYSSKLLDQFWRPGGVFNDENEKEILLWMGKNDLGTVPIVFFIEGGEYKEKREKALRDLALAR